MQVYYIKTPQELQQLCDRLQGSAELALDTEFMRDKSYFARLCLLQIANEKLIACVDAIELTDLKPLLDILYDKNILKVMHAARQDLEIFYDLRGVLPQPVFDTQIAATLLEHGEQISYQALVRGMLQVDLEKSHTRTNWAQRPLDQGQLRYAEDDVRYLLEIGQRQRRQLEDKGCLEWLKEDFADLTNTRNYVKLPQEAWRRIRGIRVLQGAQLAVLRELAAWREQRAKTIDKPRRWILRDDVLVDLARRLPQNMEMLQQLNGLEPHTVKRVGVEIVDVINHTLMQPEQDWPTLGFRFAPENNQEALIDAMMAMARQCSLEHRISPGALTTRRDLEQFLTGKKDNPLLHGWRKMLLGRKLQAFLNGKLSLHVQQGNLEMTQWPPS